MVVWQVLSDMGVADTAINSCNSANDGLNLHAVKAEHSLSDEAVSGVDSYCVPVSHAVSGRQILSDVGVESWPS